MKHQARFTILVFTVACFLMALAYAVQPTEQALVKASEASRNGAPAKARQIHLSHRKRGRDVLQRALEQAQAGATLPLWSYNIVSPVDGKSYTGAIVGRSPFFNGHRSTNIQVELIPVILTYEDAGTVFDPTAYDSCLGDSVLNLVLHSPIFNNADYVMNGVDVGSSQYLDAFQRGNFWNAISATGDSYHTKLSVNVLPAQSLTVPYLYGGTNLNFY